MIVRYECVFCDWCNKHTGRHIVTALLKQGEQVRIISRRKSSSGDDKLEVVEGDLR